MPDAARWSLSGAQAQSIAHNSVFAPPTTLHPYHDLPLEMRPEYFDRIVSSYFTDVLKSD